MIDVDGFGLKNYRMQLAGALNLALINNPSKISSCSKTNAQPFLL